MYAKSEYLPYGETNPFPPGRDELCPYHIHTREWVVFDLTIILSVTIKTYHQNKWEEEVLLFNITPNYAKTRRSPNISGCSFLNSI
jgi:hypothetical protein